VKELKVLLVDDSPYNLFVLEELIQSISMQIKLLKVETFKAYSGKDALEISKA
jgi:CheY-like chemotaxis protein